MAIKQKRDSAYYEARLQRDHAAIYSDFKAGKYLTITDAAVAAGLKKRRTNLQEMANAWSKATASERADFLQLLAGKGVVFPSVLSQPVVGTVIATIAVNQKLTVSTSDRIKEIMSKRRLKPGDVMAEMGYPRLDASVATALARETKLRPDVISALENWLDANSSV